MAFAADFKPHTWIHGGDMLDCGAISHHTKGKPGQTEGLRLLADAEEGHALFIKPVEDLVPKSGKLIYITGNHERFLDDLTDEMPSLEGIISLPKLLKLNRWQVIPQGGYVNLGKLTFVHGDQLSGGEHVAKAAVAAYERSIRFGHFHTAQQFTKTSPISYKLAKTGQAVPCLCTKLPSYGKGRPNKWVQGFCFGYISADGTFTDYVPLIIDGKFAHGGKIYKG